MDAPLRDGLVGLLFVNRTAFGPSAHKKTEERIHTSKSSPRQPLPRSTPHTQPNKSTREFLSLNGCSKGPGRADRALEIVFGLICAMRSFSSRTVRTILKENLGSRVDRTEVFRRCSRELLLANMPY